MSDTVTTCLTLKAAEDRLGVKTTKLASLIRDKEIEVFRIGRRVLIRDDVLQAYIDKMSGRVLEPA